MRKMTKTSIVLSSSFKRKPKRGEKREKTCSSRKWCFRERERDFSLDLRAIRPSEFVGTRRKVALRRETYAWVPILRSFEKLREVGVSSYFIFFTLFKCFIMFRLV